MRDETYKVLAAPSKIASEMNVLYHETEKMKNSEPSTRGYWFTPIWLSQYVKDSEMRRNALKIEHQKALEAAVELIHKIPEGLGRQIVTMHWINGMKFREIAKEIPASERTMYREYKKAVSIMDKSWQ